MNKVEFLHILELTLVSFKIEDKKEILYDYEEHFRIGEENGKSEAELIEELGDPKNIALQYNNSSQLETKEEKPKLSSNLEERPIIVPIIATLALLLFNLIFILGPYLGVAGTLFGLFVASVGITIGGIAMVLGIIIIPIFSVFSGSINGFSSVVIMFLGLGTTAMGLLFTIGMSYVVKYFYKLTIKYIKWNIRVIKG
jgi:uncharacterized membrane protein